jgi:hypothetical protein
MIRPTSGGRPGHYSPKVLWQHYHTAVLKKEAEKFWFLTPRKKVDNIVSFAVA